MEKEVPTLGNSIISCRKCYHLGTVLPFAATEIYGQLMRKHEYRALQDALSFAWPTVVK